MKGTELVEKRKKSKKEKQRAPSQFEHICPKDSISYQEMVIRICSLGRICSQSSKKSHDIRDLRLWF